MLNAAFIHARGNWQDFDKKIDTKFCEYAKPVHLEKKVQTIL